MQVRFCVLYPPSEKSATDESVVLRLEYGKLRYLFASDIDKRDETLLLRKRAELRSAVLKVPRHGSATASTRGIYRRECSRRSRSSPPARAADRKPNAKRLSSAISQAGAEVLRTYEDGAIIVESDGNTLRYPGYKSGKNRRNRFNRDGREMSSEREVHFTTEAQRRRVRNICWIENSVPRASSASPR